MNCLIIKNDGIGDLVLSSGVIAAISHIFNGDVDLITCKKNREVAESLYGIKNCLYVSRDDLTFSGEQANNDEYVLNWLKNKQYDYAICLRRFIRQSSLVLMKYTHAKNKYCAWQFPTNINYEFAKEISKDWIHYSGDMKITSELIYYYNFIKEIFKKDVCIEPRLNISFNPVKKIDSKNVGIVIGGKSSKWSTNHFIDFILRLQRKKWKIYLFGGMDARHVSMAIEQRCLNVKSFVGKSSMLDSIRILQNIDILVGNDTGFTHFASLIVPKSLIVLGGGTFNRFFPWTTSCTQYVIYHGMSCFDCDWRCRHSKRHCIELITAEDVYKYFEQIISDDEEVEKMRNINTLAKGYQIAWRRYNENVILNNFPCEVDYTE